MLLLYKKVYYTISSNILMLYLAKIKPCFMNKSEEIKEYIIDDKDGFKVCKGNLEFCNKRPTKMLYMSFGLVKSGEADFLINLTTYHLEKNAELIIMPGTIIEVINKSSDFSFVFCSFVPELFNEATVRINVEQIRQIVNLFPILNDKENLIKFELFYKAVKMIYDEKNHMYRRQIAVNDLQNYIFNLSYIVQKKRTSLKITKLTNKDIIFKNFIELVKDNFRQNRNIDFYASKLCISSRYLLKICHNTIHLSPKQIVDKIIIVEIKMLLQSSTKSIQEISNNFNFPDQSSFSRFFKRHVGISPIAFRNNNDYNSHI